MWSQSAHGIAGPDKELQTLLVAGEQDADVAWKTPADCSSVGWSIARAIGAIVGPTIGATLYQPTPTGMPKTWGSAGSPGLVSLVAASLAVSALSGLITTHVPEMKRLLVRTAGAFRKQPASIPEEQADSPAVNDEYEMKPIQGECLNVLDLHFRGT